MNSKKNLGIAIVLGLAIFIYAFLSVFGPFLKNLSGSKPVQTQETKVKNTSGNTADQKSTQGSTGKVASSAPVQYSLAEISAHNSATSCWSAINGGVYDLTDWVDSHPGGRMAILMICGKDGSPLFDSQHGGEKRPTQILEKFTIGELKK